MATDAPEERLVNPLERFTSGGWGKGLLRLALGLGVLAVVLRFAARDAVTVILDRDVGWTLLLGVPVHLLQRAGRVEKWRRMIEHSGLVARRFTFLLRVQLIGMVANLLLPVSEALKIWAVSRSRKDLVRAGESLVIEGLLHSATVGALGLCGAIVTASASVALWAAAAAMTLLPIALIAALQWRGRRRRTIHIIDARVLLCCALETACQVFLYAIACRAIGIEIGVSQVLALAPLLFLGDVVMVTPSGLGLREALFSVVLQTLSGAPADASVAVALLITAILLVASALGGALALVVPAES